VTTVVPTVVTTKFIAKAEELFAKSPVIDKPEILALNAPRA